MAAIDELLGLDEDLPPGISPVGAPSTPAPVLPKPEVLTPEELRRRSREEELQKYIAETPEKRAQRKLEEIFGKPGETKTTKQKIAPYAAFAYRLLKGGPPLEERYRKEAMDEYAKVAPSLRGELATISAERRADEANQRVRDVAKMQADMKGAQLSLDSWWKGEQVRLKDMDAATQAKRADAYVTMSQRITNDAEFARRLNGMPEADRKALLNSYADVQAVKSVFGGGGGAGGTTTTQVGEKQVPMPITGPGGETIGIDLFKVPGYTTTSTRTKGQGGVNPAQQWLQQRGINVAPVGGAQVATPQVAAPQRTAAPRPAAPAGPKPVMAPEVPLGYKPDPNMDQDVPYRIIPVGRTEYAPGETRGAGAGVDPRYRQTHVQASSDAAQLAGNVVRWAASGELSKFAGLEKGGDIGGWIRRVSGEMGIPEATFDRLLKSGTLASVVELSGAQFSASHELSRMESMWPKKIDSPDALIKRALLVHFAINGDNYARTLPLTSTERGQIGAEVGKYVEQRINNVMGKLKRGEAPTRADLDARQAYGLAIKETYPEGRTGRLAIPRGFGQAQGKGKAGELTEREKALLRGIR